MIFNLLGVGLAKLSVSFNLLGMVNLLFENLFNYDFSMFELPAINNVFLINFFYDCYGSLLIESSWWLFES